MFLTTLPIVFTFTSLFNALEACLFLAAVFGLVYFYTPEPDLRWREQTGKNWYKFLHTAWLGNSKLWRAFWPFFLFVNGLLMYADYRIANVTYTIASWLTVHGMAFLPIVWWTVAVWRCSIHTSRKIYSAGARTLVVYFYLELVLRGFLYWYFPNTLFDCRLLVMQYGDCL